jgi:phosphoserine phosphatase
MSSAAFFRVEGTLLPRPSLHAAAWLVSSSQTFGERIARLGNVALATPLSLAGELNAGSTATRMTWMGVRGMTEDRLAVLGEEYFEKYVRDDLLEVGLYLLKKAKSEKQRVVLISDNVDLVMKPLADALGADDLVCNRLEMRKLKATGRLEDPVIGGNVAGQWARAFAEEHRIDLGASFAYGASGADSLLLSAIGRPCAVNPDRQLRRIARDHEWPVVER